MPYERKDRLRLANAALRSDEWKLISEEITKELTGKVFELHTALKDGETNKTFFNEGIRIGLEFALNTPGRIAKENEKFFDRLYSNLVGDVPK